MSRPATPNSPSHPPKAGGRVRIPSQPSHPGTYFIGRYRVVDEIGVGGMATVHLARMDGAGGFQKWVAIKRIHPHLVENEQVVKMFLDEARIAASISHPNVAQVFDLGSHEDTHWIAMEYLHGEPLREVLRHIMETGQPLGPPLAARVIADAAEGLHSAHELRGKDGVPLNLVHRDVTPHNLFLTYDGVMKVVDFGIAKVTGRLSSTQAGTLKGKIAYMAPEQIRDSNIDRRTDIFALGVVLWELSTGRRLFRMDTDLETVERVQACVVPPPSTIVHDYPVQLESIVMRALRKKPEERYQTARELSRALQQYLMQSSQFVGPQEVSAYLTELFGERIKQREAHLKWVGEVTKTLSFGHLKPAFLAAGLSMEQAQRNIADEFDDFDDDDDDEDETVVEPFQAVFMREAEAHHVQGVPRSSSSSREAFVFPKPSRTSGSSTFEIKPGAATTNRSQDRIRHVATEASLDASATFPVIRREPSIFEHDLASEDLIDDDDDEDAETLIRGPAELLIQDRIFQTSRRPATPEPVPTPFGPPVNNPSVTPSGIVPHGPHRSGTGEGPAIAEPRENVRSGSPVSLQSQPIPGPNPSFDPLPLQAQIRPIQPPFGAAGYDPMMGSSQTMGEPYNIYDASFDETQWARGLRGSPILVYAAAAIGGFLIVAVLIAVLFGGPEQGARPSAPLQTPTPASS